MSLPTNLYLVHNGTFSQSPETFEDEFDAISSAEEQAAFYEQPFYVAAYLIVNAVAHKAKPPKKRKASPKRSTGGR